MDTATEDIEPQPPPGIDISTEELPERGTGPSAEIYTVQCDLYVDHTKSIMYEYGVGRNDDDK